MFCIRCGMQLGECAAFCSRCGTQVAPVAGQEATMAGQQGVAAEISPKSRLVTTLLACPWLVVGVFGAHRFYVGKTRTAVAMLLLGLAPIGCMAMAFLTMVFGVSTADSESDSMPPALLGFFVFYGLAYLCGLAAGAWALVDFIFAVSGNFKDAQGRLISTWEDRKN